MPRVSKNTANKVDERLLKDELHALLSSLNSTPVLKNFLHYFLTKEEHLMLAKRLALFDMLATTKNPNDIKDMLEISYETARSYIARYETLPIEFKNLLKEYKNQKKKPSRLSNALNLMLKSKTNSQARAKVLQGDFD